MRAMGSSAPSAPDPESRTAHVLSTEVGWPGASQPPAPSDPGVTVSRHRALLISPSGRADLRPMREETGLAVLESGPPAHESLMGPQPSVFLPGPAPQVGVDAPQEGHHGGAVEPSVVVHPPGDDGVQPSRQVV